MTTTHNPSVVLLFIYHIVGMSMAEGGHSVAKEFRCKAVLVHLHSCRDVSFPHPKSASQSSVLAALQSLTPYPRLPPEETRKRGHKLGGSKIVGGYPPNGQLFCSRLTFLAAANFSGLGQLFGDSRHERWSILCEQYFTKLSHINTKEHINSYPGANFREGK